MDTIPAKELEVTTTTTTTNATNATTNSQHELNNMDPHVRQRSATANSTDNTTNDNSATTAGADGQHHQYAEYDPNLGPQVMLSDDPEPVVLPPAPMSATGDGSVNGLMDDNNEKGGRAARCWGGFGAWVRRNPWYTAGIISGIVCTLALTIALPVIITSFSREGASIPSSIPTASSSSATASSTASQSTASAEPSGVSAPAECNPSHFSHNVVWAGVAGTTSVPWQPLPASSGANCCAQCYKAFDDGCQGWFYDPDGKNPTPCTIIYNSPGRKPDDTCPKGHVFLTFSTDDKHPNSLAGAGPCGTVGSATGGPKRGIGSRTEWKVGHWAR